VSDHSWGKNLAIFQILEVTLEIARNLFEDAWKVRHENLKTLSTGRWTSVIKAAVLHYISTFIIGD
jgi:hypothetical protein